MNQIAGFAIMKSYKFQSYIRNFYILFAFLGWDWNGGYGSSKIILSNFLSFEIFLESKLN